MKICFISGPYRADTPAGVRANIERARSVAEAYWRKGYAVICPHANSAFMDGIVPDQAFLDGDIEMLRRCDVVVMMEKWTFSDGARAEHDIAMGLGIEIIYEGKE